MKKINNKFTLTGTGNNGFRHRYSVKKNESFKITFAEFMEILGFDKEKILKSFFAYEHDENDEEIRYEIKIKNIIDVCRHYQNKNFDVDVFYGHKRIIILIRSKMRKSFVNYLKTKADWIKLDEVEEIRKNKKRKKQILPIKK